MKIPRGHPRYVSLKERHALVEGYEKGITALAGLIAQGRGEAFDYLIGEKTTPPAEKAIRTGVAALLLAKNPAISVNGNTAVLCPKEMVELSKITGAKLEINLFYRSEERVKKIEELLLKNGASRVYGVSPTEEIKGISSERKWADREGIYASDVVLVALEDGDRTEALVKAGKKVIAIDLNPLSRTATKADITIVDNVTRALPEMIKEAKKMKGREKNELMGIVEGFDNPTNLKNALIFIRKRLEEMEFSGWERKF
jgi:4-phosphopantoate--beta-alanine ligase